MTTIPTQTDLALAESLLARGNSLKDVADILSVTQVSLQPVADKAEALMELRTGYEKGSPTQTFGDWAASFVADNPDNLLGLNIEKPWLSVSGMARKEEWTKGQFQSTVAPSSGRPRVDNSEEKLLAAAQTALTMAQTDKRLNLKLAQVKAAAEHEVTDINGMTKHLQSLAPTLWKPRS